METVLKSSLQSLRAEHGFPGAVAAAELGGRSAVAATGMADVDAQTPMSTDHRMMSGSIGKTFVAVTTLRLVEENALRLDSRIARWLGDRPWFDELPNGDDITIRMLLSHTSGLANHVTDPDFVRLAQSLTQKPRNGPGITPESLVRLILDDGALFPPGEGFHYTDTGYIVLGLAIEAATDRSYYEWVSERILKPLNLSRTTPAVSRHLPGLVPGYLEVDNPFGLPTVSLIDGMLITDPSIEWTGRSQFR